MVLFPSSRMEKIIRPKPDSPSRVLESEFDIHVAGLEDTPLFDKTGYRKILLQTDENAFQSRNPVCLGRSEAVSKKKVFGL